jgi:hypothetical protein
MWNCLQVLNVSTGQTYRSIVSHLCYACLCGTLYFGAKISLYMLQFRATNLLENLLDFHLGGALLLQTVKCSMSSSTAT